MMRLAIDVDEKILAAASRELGTTTEAETFIAAIAFVANRSKVAEAFDDPLMWGTPELADAAVRRAARR
jgi:Arc/MetJ family transcription regulator